MIVFNIAPTENQVRGHETAAVVRKSALRPTQQLGGQRHPLPGTSA